MAPQLQLFSLSFFFQITDTYTQHTDSTVRQWESWTRQAQQSQKRSSRPHQQFQCHCYQQQSWNVSFEVRLLPGLPSESGSSGSSGRRPKLNENPFPSVSQSLDNNSVISAFKKSLNMFSGPSALKVYCSCLYPSRNCNTPPCPPCLL